jgi:hemerythrin-like metal-binding protein
MLLMAWHEKYNTGITEIDNYHKKIFEILKQLRTNIKHKKPGNVISPLIDCLLINSDKIFKFEEKYMSAGNYFDLEHHRVEHMVFLSRITDFRNNFLYEDYVSVLQSLDFLIHWLTFHIEESDKEYSDVILK